MREVSYVLPIRVATPVSDDLVAYIRALTAHAEVIVVDGSGPDVFADLHQRCGAQVRHVRPDARHLGLVMGKVAGVLTGLRLATHERVVIADDDVRYTVAQLRAVTDELDSAEIVRPQNYFDPLPWHAWLDTGRILLNRMSGGDWPGTLAVRRSALEQTGGYDGNVMFENLEMVRTVEAGGGRECVRLDLLVHRAPPSTEHFWSQRVRQAYDELARPGRLVVQLALAPAAVLLFRRYGMRALAASAIAAVAAAAAGRQRGHGVRVFPRSAVLAAPLWLIERAVCAWLALGARLVLGGIPYRGRIIRTAANSRAVLAQRVQRRMRSSPTLDAACRELPPRRRDTEKML